MKWLFYQTKHDFYSYKTINRMFIASLFRRGRKQKHPRLLLTAGCSANAGINATELEALRHIPCALPSGTDSKSQAQAFTLPVTEKVQGSEEARGEGESWVRQEQKLGGGQPASPWLTSEEQ